MSSSGAKRLLWDDAKFSKQTNDTERLTGVFGEKLINQTGILQLPVTKQLAILDNACGTGVVTQALQEGLKDRPASSFEITCGDFADAMINAATGRIESNGWTNTRALKVDAQDTKLPSNHFTHVFTNFGPMLFPNQSAMLSECNRMLQSHGVCGFTTWKHVPWIDDLRAAFDGIPELPKFPSSEVIMGKFSKGDWGNPEYIEGRLKEHGFENVVIKEEHNVSHFRTKEQLRAVLKPCLGIMRTFWTDEERERFSDDETVDKVGRWYEETRQGGPVSWHWIALVTTSNKSE